MRPAGSHLPDAVGWARAAILLLGGGLAFGRAPGVLHAYHRVASVAVAPDGQERSAGVLPGANGCDVRVVVRGALFSRYDGAWYDAAEAHLRDGESWAHNCLELRPPGLVPAPDSDPERAGEHAWIPTEGLDLAGQTVAARLDPEPLFDTTYLPDPARDRALEGELRLEVWERDRRRQSILAGLLDALGAALITAGALRVRVCWRGRRLAPARGTEAAGQMERVRRRRQEALAALATSPAGDAALCRQVDALYRLAEELASAAERSRRAGGPAPPTECLRGLERIEAALAGVAARLPAAPEAPAEDIEALACALEAELQLLEEAGREVGCERMHGRPAS